MSQIIMHFLQGFFAHTLALGNILVIRGCFYSLVLVHRHFTGHTGEGAAEQVHSWPKRGGSQCYQEVPSLCSPGVCHPQRGDGLFQEEKVRTYNIKALMSSSIDKGSKN